MKKTTLACLVILTAFTLVPQTLEGGVGLKAGFSLARISQTSTEPLPFAWDDLPYFVGGLSFEAGLGFVSFGPEVLYVRMGGKYTVDADNGLEYRLHYIQVPMLLKLNVVPAGPIRPFIYGGAYGAYLAKAEGLMKVLGVTTEVEFTEDYERFDYGVVGGVGLAFKLPVISVSIEGRYNYGLMNIAKDPAPGDATKNRCLMALVGLSF